MGINISGSKEKEEAIDKLVEAIRKFIQLYTGVKTDRIDAFAYSLLETGKKLSEDPSVLDDFTGEITHEEVDEVLQKLDERSDIIAKEIFGKMVSG